MSVIFRIRPAGQLDGVTVPVIQTVVQDPATGIYDVTFNSLNNNLGVLDVQELMRVGLGNTADDFLVPQFILTDGAGATTLALSKEAYNPGGPEAGISRELLWEYIGAPEDTIGPKPFLNYTGQRLILNSDNAVAGESEIYVVVLPVASSSLLEAVCCTQEEAEGGGGIAELTSADGSVVITNPTGPVVDLSAPDVGDLTAITSLDGSVTIVDGTGPVPDLSVPAAAASPINSLTGLTRLSAGILSIASATEVGIAAGTGQVVDNTTDPNNPTLVEVTWGASVVTDLFLATDVATTFFIDAAGAVVQKPGTRDAEDRRNLIFLGFSAHEANTTVESVGNTGVVAGSNAGMTYDIVSAVGDINIFGNAYSANGVNLLLDKAVGRVFGSAIGATAADPNFADNALQTAIATYVYTYQPAVPGTPYNTAVEVDIDPDFFDDGSGTLAAMSPNKFQIQRLVFEPRTGLTAIEYGQTEYNSLGEAIDGITENNIQNNPALRGLLLRGWLVVKTGTTDLTDLTDAAFFENVDENPAGAASGAGITGVDVQDGGVTQATAVPILNFVAGAGIGVTVAESPAGTAEITLSAPGAAGDVVGPGSSLADEIPRYSGTTGKIIDAPGFFRQIGGAIAFPLINAEGAAIEVGDVMEIMPGGTPGTVELATADIQAIPGVCVEAAAAGAVPVWLAVSGECTIKCNTEAVAVGDFIGSVGGGLAHPHVGSSGASFAIAVTSKGAGVGTIRAVLAKRSDVQSLETVTVDGTATVYAGTDGMVIESAPGGSADQTLAPRFIGGALCFALTNDDGTTVVVGDIMKASTTQAGSCLRTTANGNDSFVGVVAEGADDGDPVWLALLGEATVRCSGAVALGDYIDISGTTGLGNANPVSTENTIGMALTAKGAGTGPVQVMLCGCERF